MGDGGETNAKKLDKSKNKEEKRNEKKKLG